MPCLARPLFVTLACVALMPLLLFGCTDPSGQLHDAIAKRDVQKVMKLVKAGADTRVLNANGHTPLIAAVLQRDLTIVQLLIDGGADVDGKDSEEWTPLMWCQDEDILRLLVESGANVNAQNDRGETPLMFASTPESAAILIEAGADIHIKDDRGYSAFERFRSSQNPYASDIMVILKNAEKAQ